MPEALSSLKNAERPEVFQVGLKDEDRSKFLKHFIMPRDVEMPDVPNKGPDCMGPELLSCC